jgi:predicted phage replisome organizer
MVNKKRTSRRINTKGKGVLNVAKGFVISEKTFDNEKIQLIETLPSGDETLIIYFKLLSLACKSNAGGFLIFDKRIPYNEEMLAGIFHRSLPKVKFALQTLIQFGMIEETDEGFKIDEFVDWLGIDGKAKEQTRERVAKHREKQKALPEPSEESDKPKKKTKVYEEDSVEMMLSKYLFELMRRNNPEAKEPNFQSWSNEIRKMINLDQRKPEQIKNMITWCQKDSFWKGNILSTKKLREKYDQLKVRALEEWERQQTRTTNARQAEIDDIFNRLEGGNSIELPRSIEGN